MSADTPTGNDYRETEHDARLLADLRAWRERVTGSEHDRWSARLTLDELDMLLRAADERDALRRQLCEMPDDVTPNKTPSSRRFGPHPIVMHIAGRGGGVLCERLSPPFTLAGSRRFANCPACIEVYETRRCDAICDGDGGRSSCFTPWCRCTVCHGTPV